MKKFITIIISISYLVSSISFSDLQNTKYEIRNTDHACPPARRGSRTNGLRPMASKASDIWFPISGLNGRIISNIETGRIKFASDKPVLDLECDLWFVRQGETIGNITSGLFQGALDEDINQLTPRGRKQAKEAAEELFAKLESKIIAGEEIIVYTSELTRAKETADAFIQLVQEKTGITIVPIEEKLFKEISFGIWDNKTPNDFDAEQRKLIAKYRKGLDATMRGLGGQNFINMLLRAKDLLTNLNELHKDKTVVCFGHGTHSGAIRTVLGDKTLLDDSGQIDWRNNMLSNAKPARLSQYPDYTWKTLTALEETKGGQTKAAKILRLNTRAAVNSRLKCIIEKAIELGDQNMLTRIETAKNLKTSQYSDRKEELMAALEKTKGNKKEAAEILKVTPGTLSRWIKSIIKIAIKLNDRDIWEKLLYPYYTKEAIEALEQARGNKKEAVKILSIPVPEFYRRLRLIKKIAADSDDQQMLDRIAALKSVRVLKYPPWKDEFIAVLERVGGNHEKAAETLETSELGVLAVMYKINHLIKIATELGEHDMSRRLRALQEGSGSHLPACRQAGVNLKVLKTIAGSALRPMASEGSEIDEEGLLVLESDNETVMQVQEFLVEIGNTFIEKFPYGVGLHKSEKRLAVVEALGFILRDAMGISLDKTKQTHFELIPGIVCMKNLKPVKHRWLALVIDGKRVLLIDPTFSTGISKIFVGEYGKSMEKLSFIEFGSGTLEYYLETLSPGERMQVEDYVGFLSRLPHLRAARRKRTIRAIQIYEATRSVRHYIDTKEAAVHNRGRAFFKERGEGYRIAMRFLDQEPDLLAFGMGLSETVVRLFPRKSQRKTAEVIEEAA